MARRKTKNRPTRRYVMTSVSGFMIHPGASGKPHGDQRQPIRSFAVLDTAYCYRIVEEFLSGNSRSREAENEKLARNLRDRLNRLDEASR